MKKSVFSLVLFRSGFTLIELLVVLVIISILSVLVVPRIGSQMTRLNIKTAVKRTAAVLRYARSCAYSEKMVYTALFDPDNGRVEIVSKNIYKISPEESNDSGENSGKKIYSLPGDIRLRSADPDDNQEGAFFSIIFFPDGRSSGGEILLTNARKREYSIKVDFITGEPIISLIKRSEKRF